MVNEKKAAEAEFDRKLHADSSTDASDKKSPVLGKRNKFNCPGKNDSDEDGSPTKKAKKMSMEEIMGMANPYA